jgi:hypothetical protein
VAPKRHSGYRVSIVSERASARRLRSEALTHRGGRASPTPRRAKPTTWASACMHRPLRTGRNPRRGPALSLTCRTVALHGRASLCCVVQRSAMSRPTLGSATMHRQGPTAANAKADSQQSLARHAPAKLARADSDFEERPVSAQASTAHQAQSASPAGRRVPSAVTTPSLGWGGGWAVI